MVQQVNQLEFDYDVTTGRIFLKRVRMDNGYPVYYMRVGEERGTYHVRYKEYRQEPPHYVLAALFYPFSLVAKIGSIPSRDNPYLWGQ